MNSIRIPLLVMVSVAWLTAGVASAGSIGFVDAERAVATVAEGKAKIAELESWAEPRRQRLQELQQAAQAAERDLRTRGGVVSGEVRSELERTARDAVRAFEDARREFQRELEKKQEDFFADIAVKVGTVASDYARTNGYDAIFVLNAQPLIYVAEAADLTDTVIRLYDERFPVE
jgi:Skp family chaperone for outer membrane proteins